MSSDSFKRTPEGMLEDFKERIELLERRLALQPAYPEFPDIPPFWPVGIMWLWPGDSAPMSEFMLCQGQSLLRASYAELFTIIGTKYGAADGTHFNLPDMRTRVPVGLDAGGDTAFDTLGETGGAKTHTLTIGELPAHGHQERYAGNVFSGNDGGALGGMTSAGGVGLVGAEQSTADTGGGGAHNNLQPYIVLNYIVKVL